jgi:CMP-N,N'-diacetyllegionaminic acid synthase
MSNINYKKINLIIIPARKNSKSIKNKNIKIFCKKPLIYWSIKVALDSKLGTVCVTTDCKEIRKIAIEFGAEAPFLRPKCYAKDTTPTDPVIIHALNFYKKKGANFKNFFLLQPTSPFRKKNDIINSWNIFKRSKCSSVVSVSEATANHNPEWILILKKNGIITNSFSKSLNNFAARRQDLPKAYFRNDFVYLSKISNLFSKNPSIYGNKPKLLISNKSRLDFDLNTNKDWFIAEKVFKYK